MILEIVKYGHPVLRQKGARVEKIDAGIKQLIADMLETVTAAKGVEITFKCGGLLSRAIQHELDHLNGILFIDRMLRSEKEELKPKLDDLLEETKAALKAPKVPADSAGHQ